MTITIEKPSLDTDETELPTEATIEAITNLLKASAPPAPEVAPTPTVKVTAARITQLDPQGAPVETFIMSPEERINLLEYKPGGPTFTVKLSTNLPDALTVASCRCDMCASADGPVTNQEVAHALDEAAKYLEKNGWIQGTFYAHGRACAVGAIMVGVTRFPQAYPGLMEGRAGYVTTLAIEQVERWLVRTGLERRGTALESWNDRPGRTAQEVINVLRGTAGWLLERAAT